MFVRDVPAQQPSDQPPVVLLHGFPGSSHDWAGVSPALGVSRRVLTLDLPGYGLSAKPGDGDYSLFTQADVVEAVLDQHGITACSLVAHDMGDTVAAELMARRTAGTARAPAAVDRCAGGPPWAPQRCVGRAGSDRRARDGAPAG